jgi:hypothetical protein
MVKKPFKTSPNYVNKLLKSWSKSFQISCQKNCSILEKGWKMEEVEEKHLSIKGQRLKAKGQRKKAEGRKGQEDRRR